MDDGIEVYQKDPRVVVYKTRKAGNTDHVRRFFDASRQSLCITTQPGHVVLSITSSPDTDVNLNTTTFGPRSWRRLKAPHIGLQRRTALSGRQPR